MKSLGAFLALSILAALPVLAQQQQPSESAFGETIDVRVVNVEVVVTDKQGNRVTGLGPGDFRLRVDGKEVPVQYFTEVRGGQAVALEEAGSGQSSAVAGLPALAPGSPVGTSYLVFIDDYFSIAARRDEVLRSLMDSLGHLGPEDRMAVVAYDGRKIDMLSNWSDSDRALHRGFQEALGRQAYGFQRLAELRAYEASRRITGTLGTVDSRSAFANRVDLEEQSYMELIADQVRRSVTAAVSTMRGFAAPPGRKVLILLSGGWPFSPAEYVVNNPNRPILTRDVPTGEQLFEPLVDTANLLGYTIYPVDVPGVEGTGPDASESGPGSNGLLNLREQEIHASLDFTARETGGKALINGMRAEALQTAESDTRSYYWLGFTPERQRNDKRHDIQVDVLREGLKVRSRDNYFDLAKNTEVSMMVESALLFGNPPGAASMPIQVGKPVAKGRREIEVPITLAIPLSSMTVVPIDGKHVAELELRISVLDEKGNRSAVPVIPIRLTADKPPSESPGQYVRYDTTLKMRKIRQHLIAAIYDPLSGKITTAEADVVPDRKP
ncbi:MAG TPA: VWA domain-containing protein [Thermoanaerobaculia bacterium]|jgi:VWFA-related protein|nr:VWA domain-containing protein [Thermoanaerobaculia bacterium]